MKGNLKLLLNLQKQFCDAVMSNTVRQELVLYFKRQHVRFLKIIDLVDKIVGQKKTKLKILDVGCYPGIIAMCMAEKGHEVCGLDRCPELWDSHVAWFNKLNIKFAELEKTDCLPFEEGAFDVILFLEIIEHLKDKHPADILQFLAKYLKPGGKIVISTPNVRAISKVIALLIGQNIYHSYDDLYRKGNDFAHIHEYTKGEIEAVVKESGLQLDTFMFTTYGFYNDSLLRKIAHYAIYPLKVVPCFREGMITTCSKK